MTKTQKKALDWLTANGGSAVFDPSLKTITAKRSTIAYVRSIWTALRDADQIEFYNDGTTATPFGGVRIRDLA